MVAIRTTLPPAELKPELNATANQGQPWWLLCDLAADTWKLKGNVPGVDRSQMTVTWLSSLSDVSSASRVRWAGWRSYAKALTFQVMESDRTRVSKTSSLGAIARELRAACEFFCFELGKESVNSLRPVDIQSFEKHVKSLEIGWSAAEKKLLCIGYMWLLAPDVGSGLGFNPYPRNSLKAVAKRIGVCDGHTATIKPKDFFGLINHALGLIANADDTVQKLDTYISLRSTGSRKVSRLYKRKVGESSGVLFRQVRALYGAALTVVFSLTAHRKHEQSGLLTVDSNAAVDGADLAGTEHKTAGTTIGRRTSRPVIQEVRDALRVIERLTADTRKIAGSHKLTLRLPFQHSTSGGLIPEFELTTSPLYKLLEAFAKSAGYGRLRPHMFRRAFAMLWAWRFEVGDLYYLSKLLLHNSFNFTVAYVEDEDIWEFLPEEMDEFTNQIFEEEFLGSSKIAGGISASLRRYARLLQATVSVMTPAAASSFAESLIERQGMTVVPSSDGYCFMSKTRRRQARCSTDGDGPNYANRTPSACAGCPNFGVKESKRVIWAERERLHALVLKSTKSAELREASAEGAAWCQRVQKQLDGALA